ncbi:MAG: OmpH family outer membrane protein [Chitinophagaceae bacterium]|nr:OmpH family outer membrane protein [Chitinophagaceae bacterium]MCB9045223.1 OmpH family outer membrane protein [Chitinophagales bacterium]
MKNLSILFSTLAFVGVLALFGLRMSEHKSGATQGAADKEQSTNTDTRGRIAYVNIDSLEARYEYLKNKKADFEERKKGMSNELERSQRQFQQDYQSAERKAQAGTLTEAEYQSTAKRLQQMKQSLEAREAALTEKLLAEQDEFNKDLQQRLDNFLADYNKDKHYDYILSYSKSVGLIMLVNEELDITDEVVAGMNELYAKEATKENKDTKKKNK